MINTPIVKLDLHGMTADESIAAIDKKLAECGSGVYRIEAVHGYNRGTAIRDAIKREFGYGYDKVKRIRPGDNPGVTDLILREM